MVSHHIPDPVWFWAAAGVITMAAVWLTARRTDSASRIFAFLLVLVVIGLVNFALIFAQWPTEGLAPQAPGQVPEMPSGLGLPQIFWSLHYPVMLIGAILFAGLYPKRRDWLPPAPYHWIAAVALVGVVYLVQSLEFDRVHFLRNLVWALVFPLVGLLFLSDVLRSNEVPKTPLLLLSLAFFLYSLPTALVQALDARQQLASRSLSGMLSEIVAAQLVGGMLVATVAVGAGLWALAVAARGPQTDRRLVAFAVGLGIMLSAALLVWVDGGDWSGKRVALDLLAAVLFAVLGTAGLLLDSGRTSVHLLADVSEPVAEPATALPVEQE